MTDQGEVSLTGEISFPCVEPVGEEQNKEGVSKHAAEVRVYHSILQYIRKVKETEKYHVESRSGDYSLAECSSSFLFQG